MSVLEKVGDGYYLKLDGELGDDIILAMLKDTRQGVQESIEHTVILVAEHGLYPHHLGDIRDNTETLNALDKIIAYYGG